MRIVIAGASGFVGGALVLALRDAGHEVRRLVRRPPADADEVFWNPAAGEIDVSRLEGCDAFINLAGENISAGRWTAVRRDAIFRSRIDATRTLAAAVAKVTWKPAVLVNASAIGYYGDRGDEVLTEASSAGHGFLPEVCLAWETEAQAVVRHGLRVACLRFGVVLGADGGALAKMLPLFRFGLGGRMGAGRQWMSWIARDDVIAAIQYVLAERKCSGPLNCVAPTPVTNAEFTTTLGRVLHRPAVLPVPALALRLVVGRGMADAALLASSRAVPERLLAAGFQFRFPALEPALRQILARG
jgi:uncharacterized protein